MGTTSDSTPSAIPTLPGAELDFEVRRAGAAIARAMRPGLLGGARRADERLMASVAQDGELRAALFRLIDVSPACKTLDALGRHLGSFAGELEERPGSVRAALVLSRTRPGRGALGAAVAAGVRHTAHRFIAGASAAAASDELGRLWRRGVASSVDLLGEATVSGAEADSYAERCMGALDELVAVAGRWPAKELLECDSAGAIPRANLSVKVSSLTAMLRPEAPERGLEDAAGRLRPLLARARDLGAHIHVDMEALDSLETTVGLVLQLLGEPSFRDGPSVGVVTQAYLRDSPELVERILAWAASSSRTPPLTVRLVKGAYWDREVAEARQHGWSLPVFSNKAECDRNFELLTRRLLDARPLVRVAIGSHNLRSIAHAIAWNRLCGGRREDLELQVLRGLGDDLGVALAEQEFRVRVYSPVGDLVAGMAYLVRRLLENTSNESFLLARAQGLPLDELLAAP